MAPRTEPKTLAEAQQVAAFSVSTAAMLAGTSVSAMYLACERGEVESTRLCGRILVKSVPFLAMFGVDSDAVNVVAEATSSLDPSGARQCTSRRKSSK